MVFLLRRHQDAYTRGIPCSVSTARDATHESPNEITMSIVVRLKNPSPLPFFSKGVLLDFQFACKFLKW